eukprot:2277283-Prymnesium_polylepis.1
MGGGDGAGSIGRVETSARCYAGRSESVIWAARRERSAVASISSVRDRDPSSSEQRKTQKPRSPDSHRRALRVQFAAALRKLCTGINPSG